MLHPGGRGPGRRWRGELAVGRQHPVHVTVGAQDVCQDHRVGVIRLRPRHRMPFAVAGYRHGVDREHRSSGFPQGRNQQATRGFDPNWDWRVCAVACRGQHLDRLCESFDALLDPLLGDQLSGLVDQSDVVMSFGPIDATKHLYQRPSSPDLPYQALNWLVRTLVRTRGDLIARLWAYPPMSRSRFQRHARSPVLRQSSAAQHE